MSEGNEISRRYQGPGDNTPYVPSWLIEEQTPEYQAFLAECAKHCHCSMTICESVLAGGPCEMRIEPEPDLDDNLP